MKDQMKFKKKFKTEKSQNLRWTLLQIKDCHKKVKNLQILKRKEQKQKVKAD